MSQALANKTSRSSREVFYLWMNVLINDYRCVLELNLRLVFRLDSLSDSHMTFHLTRKNRPGISHLLGGSSLGLDTIGVRFFQSH